MVVHKQLDPKLVSQKPKTTSPKKVKKILVTCFDVSGDHNAADLLAYALKHYPNQFFFYVIAGESVEKIRSANPKSITSLRSHVVESSIGLLEGIPFVRSSLIFFKWFRQFIDETPIDLLLCIDGQGRNLILGKLAHNKGIKTAYYFPPQVSIYGGWNVKKMKPLFNLVFCPFLADHQLYQAGGVNSFLVGHPFSELTIPSIGEQKRVRKELFDSHFNTKNKYTDRELEKIIAIFPGSRYQEINLLTPVFLKTAIQLKKKYPNLKFVISCSHKKFEPIIEKLVEKYWVFENENKEELPIIYGKWDEILQSAYFIIACSGTATLKASFMGVPHVICYKISYLSYWIARVYVKIKYIGMGNILADRELSKEFINRHLKVNKLVEWISKFIDDPIFYERARKDLISEMGKLKRKEPFKIILDEILKIL